MDALTGKGFEDAFVFSYRNHFATRFKDNIERVVLSGIEVLCLKPLCRKAQTLFSAQLLQVIEQCGWPACVYMRPLILLTQCL